MQLQTQRLILRHPTQQDAAAYTAICNQEFVLRYNAMEKRTQEQVLAAFSRSAEDLLLLVHRETGRVIGEITIQEDSLRYGVNSREVSYFIDEAFCRQGYMREALRAVLRHLFDTLALDCISSRVFSANEASLALLKSLGFQQNGCIPRCVKGYGDVIYDDVLHTLFPQDLI